MNRCSYVRILQNIVLSYNVWRARIVIIQLHYLLWTSKFMQRSYKRDAKLDKFYINF